MPVDFKYHWRYYKPILFINLMLSVVLSTGYLKFYPIVFMTVGFLCSVAIVRFFEGNTNYLYCNLGISRKKLLIFSFLANFMLTILFLAVYYGFKG